MIWTFAFGKCYSRGALRFLVVFILIGTRALLITRFPLALIFSCAGFPTFAYLGFLLSLYSRAKCQILGGGVEYAIIQHLATRTRDTFVFGLDFWSLVSSFDVTFEYFDDWSAFYLGKVLIERNIGTGGLLNVWIFLWKEWLLGCGSFVRGRKGKKVDSRPFILTRRSHEEITW